MLDSSRVAVAVGAALLGFLAVLAATQPPQAAREIRRLELADLVQAEDARVRTLRSELQDLRGQLTALQRDATATGGQAEDLGSRAAELGGIAGTSGAAGAGVVVTMDDSSAGSSPTGDPNDLIVHERDIQTVVNALWAAGAAAVSIDGERLAATSAVRCAGNTLLLHGTVHSPPYEVAAIGDPVALSRGFDRQPGVGRLRSAVEAFGLRLDVEAAEVQMRGAPAATLLVASPGRGA
jgi:uncharacterized protein YlxW (UPF0749 family)